MSRHEGEDRLRGALKGYRTRADPLYRFPDVLSKSLVNGTSMATLLPSQVL